MHDKDTIFSHLFVMRSKQYALSGHGRVPKPAYKKFSKMWSKTLVFSSQLRQFLQMIIALGEYTGYIFTSSPICMVSSSVAMEILCFINIGSDSTKKVIGVEKSL